MKCCAGCIVWFSLFGTIIGIAGIGGILYYYSGSLGNIKTGISFLDEQKINTSTDSNYQYYAYACWGLAGLLLIVVLCLCGRIQLAIAVSKAAGDFITDVCQIMITPLFWTLILSIVWAACIPPFIFLVAKARFIAVNNNILTTI